MFIAGDVNTRVPLLAEVADDGHIAGYNSIKDKNHGLLRLYAEKRESGPEIPLCHILPQECRE